MNIIIVNNWPTFIILCNLLYRCIFNYEIYFYRAMEYKEYNVMW